jgi:transposase
MKMELTEQQRKELEEMAKRGEPGYLRTKALALLNLGEERRISEVGRIFRVSRDSLYEWRRRYLAEGISGLRVRPGRGPKGRANLEEVERYARQSPRNFGVGRTRWTLSLLGDVVPSLKGFSPPGVRKALRRAGYRYKRGQPWVHSPDGRYEEKKGLWTKR